MPSFINPLPNESTSVAQKQEIAFTSSDGDADSSGTEGTEGESESDGGLPAKTSKAGLVPIGRVPTKTPKAGLVPIGRLPIKTPMARLAVRPANASQSAAGFVVIAPSVVVPPHVAGPIGSAPIASASSSAATGPVKVRVKDLPRAEAFARRKAGKATSAQYYRRGEDAYVFRDGPGNTGEALFTIPAASLVKGDHGDGNPECKRLKDLALAGEIGTLANATKLATFIFSKTAKERERRNGKGNMQMGKVDFKKENEEFGF